MSEHADDTVTVAAIAASAFVSACVAHEAIGHGGACLLHGGRIELLTSVYFRCSPGGSAVDAAGPVFNLVAGAIFAGVLHAWRTASAAWRLFLVLAMAFNLFWGSGYFIYTAVSGHGDWAFLLRDPATHRVHLVMLGLLGVLTYIGSMRLVVREESSPRRLLTAYLAGGVVACASALFFTAARWPAVREAALESFGAAIGLVLLARSRASEPAPARPPVMRSSGWMAATVGIMAVFFATLGRGLA